MPMEDAAQSSPRIRVGSNFDDNFPDKADDFLAIGISGTLVNLEGGYAHILSDRASVLEQKRSALAVKNHP